MPKLKDFLAAIATKAGLNVADEVTAAFINQIPDVEVPETVQTGIDNSLISIKDATNNHPVIKNYYQKQSLDSVDKTLNDLLDEFEVDEDTRAAITAERSTYKRVPLLTKKLVELQAAKAGANNSKDKNEIQKQIDQLHQTIAAEKQARAAEKQNYENELSRFKMETKLQSLYSKYQTIHDELDPEIKATVISTLINKELQDKQAKFAFDEAGNLTLLKNDGTNFYGDNHQQITPAQLIEQTLAKTKQLRVSAPAGPANGKQHANGTRQASPPVDTNPNAAVLDMNSRALKDLEDSKATGFGVSL